MTTMKQHIVWAGQALPTGDQVQGQFAVAVAENRIINRGNLAVLRAAYPDADVTGGDDLLLLPAFVNAHDHGRGLGTLQLGVPDDLLEIWLPGLYSQPATDPYQIARYEGQLLLRAGVGTTAHSHNPRNWLDLEAESTARHVRHVVVNGEWVVRDGRSTRIDEQEVIGALREKLNHYDPAALATNAAVAQALAPYLRRFYAAWDEMKL